MFISPQVWFKTTVLVTSNISPVACSNNGKPKNVLRVLIRWRIPFVTTSQLGIIIHWFDILQTDILAYLSILRWLTFYVKVCGIFSSGMFSNPFLRSSGPGILPPHAATLFHKWNHLFIPLQTSPNHFATDILLAEEVLRQMIWIYDYTYLKPYCILCFNCSILLKNFCFPGLLPNHQPPVFFHRRFASQAEITRLQLMSAVDPKWRQTRSRFFFAEIVGQKFI